MQCCEHCEQIEIKKLKCQFTAADTVIDVFNSNATNACFFLHYAVKDFRKNNLSVLSFIKKNIGFPEKPIRSQIISKPQ